MMDVYLHTEYQHLLEQAHKKLSEGSANSFVNEKEMLKNSLNNPLLQLDDSSNMMIDHWSDDIKCARALIYHTLG